MKHTIFFRVFAVLFCTILLISCDKDFNTLGSDFIDNQHFTSTDAPGEDFDLKVINHKLGAVETWNLPINHLGISSDFIFGKTRANFVTQLLLSESKPTINSHAVVDSVVLTVPYFSKLLSTDSSGKNTYRLDSISTTNTTAGNYDPINLQVYNSNYALRDFDPNTGNTTAQKYYSDEDAVFAGQINTTAGLLNNAGASENTNFVPSSKEYVKYKVENNAMLPKDPANIETRLSPRMRLHLKNSFFQTAIIDEARNNPTNFFNNNSFKAYFKGLYFQVQDASIGSMMALDFTKADVTIYYKQDITNNDTSPTPAKEMKAMILRMSGARTVNTFINSGSTISTASLPYTSGSTMYLSGGEGHVAYVDLFSGTQLQDLKDKKVLVNDASLYFTVDISAPTTDVKKIPQRIFVYDAENYTPLYDYNFDQTTNSSNDKLKKYIHGGILESITQSDGVTKKYRFKVRITEHISNVLRESGATTKNVRIGIAITESINFPTFVELKTPVTIDGKEIKKVPIASVMNAQNAIIHGTETGDDRIRFKIYYTKPN